MKSSISVIAMIVALTILGCQENNVTDPAATAQLQTSNLSKAAMESTKPAPRPEIIQFNTTLPNPISASGTFIAIQGQVAYRMLQKVRPGNDFELRLQVNAELTPTNTDAASWRASGQSIDLVTVSEESVAFLSKTYKVDGAKAGLLLGLRFQITQYSVEIANIWLEDATIAVDSEPRY